jgi:hypothetical protein
MASLTYGSTHLQSPANAIIDTGTTLIYIPTLVYNMLLSVTSGTTDSSSGMARFLTQPTGTFMIKIGLVSYTLLGPCCPIVSGKFTQLSHFAGVMTLNYPVCSRPHYITNDLGSDLHRTHVTYCGVPGPQRSCVILQFCIGSHCLGHIPNWGACYDQGNTIIGDNRPRRTTKH